MWILSGNALAYLEDNKFFLVNDKVRTKDNSIAECVQIIPEYYGYAILGNQFGHCFVNKKDGEIITYPEQSGLRIQNPLKF